MRHLSIYLFALLTALSAKAQTEVTPYRPGITPEGVTYFLPNTALHFTLTATRTVHTPGEYAAYAERYLRIADVAQTPYEEWTIDGLEVTPYGVANPKQGYTIKLNPKTSAPLVGLSEDGCLLSVNAAAQQMPEMSKPSVTRIEQKATVPADFKTREVLSAGSTTKMAELTAAEIYDIRENRALLTKGQADFMPKDGEQLRLMLEQLDGQEAALLQLFKGTSYSEKHVFTFELVPDSAMEQVLLFRFSRHAGMVANDDLSGEPYYIFVRDQHALPAVTVPEDGKKVKSPIGDLRYLQPGRASIAVAGYKRTLLNVSMPFAQFGRVEHLGGDLFNKRFTTKVILSPTTGGIVKLDAAEPK